MEKKCKIVVLPTDKESKLYISRISGNLYFETESKIRVAPAQHLYTLSDDEIKEGDWFIWNGDNNLMKAVSDSQDYTDCYGKGSFSVNISAIGTEAKKIIATTNPDLIKEGVASISDEDIRNYCNNPVEEVLVKYFKYTPSIDEEAIYGFPAGIEICVLKTDFNGSIIIKPVEETWDDIKEEYKKYLRNIREEENWSDKDTSIFTWLNNTYEVPKKK